LIVRLALLLSAFPALVGAAEVSGMMRPGLENDFPGYHLQWSNQGSPKLMTVEEYNVIQKFGLDEYLLRRREIRAFDGRGFMVSRKVYGGEGAVEGMETNTPDALGFASESLKFRGLADIHYKWVYQRTNIPVAGLLTEETRYQADGSIHSRNLFSYDATGAETNRLMYNQTGLLEYRQSQAFDSNRNLVERILFRGTGTIQEKLSWAYSNRLPITESTFDMEGQVVRRVRRAYTNARAPGQPSGEWIYRGDGELRERSEFFYDASGRLAEVRKWDGASVFRARMTNAYDPQGRKTEEFWFKDAQTPGWKFEYLRDPKGNPVELRRLQFSPKFGETAWDLSQAVKITYNY